MRYKGYLISHGGKVRKNNEDNGYLDGVFRHKDDLFFWGYRCEKQNRLLCAAFDGVGGVDCGEVASRLAAETLFALQKENPTEVELEKYVELANNKIIHANEARQMATTFVLLSINDNQLLFSNMGDSRGYLLRDQKLTQVTRDHNMVARLLEKGILTQEQARRHPQRHTIYQFLGMKAENDDGGLMLEPFVFHPINVKAGDICLLCSDGLTDMVDDQRIRSIMIQDASVEKKAKRLLKEALNLGGKDNITILLVEATG